MIMCEQWKKFPESGVKFPLSTVKDWLFLNCSEFFVVCIQNGGTASYSSLHDIGNKQQPEWIIVAIWRNHVDGLVQDSNKHANILELLQSCEKTPMCPY